MLVENHFMTYMKFSYIPASILHDETNETNAKDNHYENLVIEARWDARLGTLSRRLGESHRCGIPLARHSLGLLPLLQSPSRNQSVGL